tara:strand:- start:5992 stop:6210 length:219 start_codon:yes stop_codon:yes gene_type:complete
MRYPFVYVTASCPEGSERQKISDRPFVTHAADDREEPFLKNAIPQHFAFAAETSRYRGIIADIQSNRDHPDL